MGLWCPWARASVAPWSLTAAQKADEAEMTDSPHLQPLFIIIRLETEPNGSPRTAALSSDDEEFRSSPSVQQLASISAPRCPVVKRERISRASVRRNQNHPSPPVLFSSSNVHSLTQSCTDHSYIALLASSPINRHYATATAFVSGACVCVCVEAKERGRPIHIHLLPAPIAPASK